MLCWNLEIVFRVRVRVWLGERGMDGIQVPDDLSLQLKVRARIFIRLRYTVVFQVPEHCGAAQMGSVSFSVRFMFRTQPCVRYSLRISLPVYWSVG